MNRIILFAIASITLQLQSAASNEQMSLQQQERSWCDTASLYKKEIILAGAVALGSVLLFKKYRPRPTSLVSLEKSHDQPSQDSALTIDNAAHICINKKSSATGIQLLKERRAQGALLIAVLNAEKENTEGLALNDSLLGLIEAGKTSGAKLTPAAEKKVKNFILQQKKLR